jgi:hypothetical protein
MTTYTRPILSLDERKGIVNAVMKIRQMGFSKTLAYLTNALYENALLSKEVNEHRAALGIDPLPTYKPDTGIQP